MIIPDANLLLHAYDQSSPFQQLLLLPNSPTGRFETDLTNSTTS